MDTLNSTIEWFLGHCADHRKLSHHTLKAYEQDLSHLRSFASAPPADISISSIDRNFVQRWLGSMNGDKPRTVRWRLAILKSMFSSLDRHGNLNSNPLAGFRIEVKVGISLPRTVARSTVRMLLRSTHKLEAISQTSKRRKIRDTALVEMLFATGMRVSEVVSTNIGSVDMERLVISVRGKGNREREIPIVCEAFREALELQVRTRQESSVPRRSPVCEPSRSAHVRIEE